MIEVMASLDELGGFQISPARSLQRRFKVKSRLFGLHVEEADIATARAASGLSVPFTLSSAGSRSIEQVQEVVDFTGEEGSEGWFQLYWPSDDRLTESLVKRAKKAGHKVLVVTLDT